MTETSSPQDRVRDFVREYDIQMTLEARLLDMASELGELAKEALKASDYGKSKFDPTQGWREEVGDVYFSLLCLADQTGVSLEDALDAALAKYAGRFGASKDIGSGR